MARRRLTLLTCAAVAVGPAFDALMKRSVAAWVRCRAIGVAQARDAAVRDEIAVQVGELAIGVAGAARCRRGPILIGSSRIAGIYRRRRSCVRAVVESKLSVARSAAKRESDEREARADHYGFCAMIACASLRANPFGYFTRYSLAAVTARGRSVVRSKFMRRTAACSASGPFG